MIDARDVLQDPKRILRLLCEAVGVEFDRSMLFRPPGLRETDGVWAKHWYGEERNRRGSNLIASGHPKCRSDCEKSKRDAGNLTTRFSNTACAKTQMWEPPLRR